MFTLSKKLIIVPFKYFQCWEPRENVLILKDIFLRGNYVGLWGGGNVSVLYTEP